MQRKTMNWWENRLLKVEKGKLFLENRTAGAYCRSMASNFNLREIPKEILI